MSSNTSKQFQQNKKNISYLSKDFNQLKTSLVEYSKYYYPNTYKDFGPGSVGMMYMELASYAGDVMSFYIDNQLQESIPTYASERKNLINFAKSAGYKVKTSTPSQVVIDLYQVIPSKQETGGDIVPDTAYLQSIKEGMTATTSDGISFITSDAVDFNLDSIDSPREITIYQRDQSGIPQNYIVKKSALAFSAQRKSIQITVESPSPFFTIELEEDNVIHIESVVDSDNEKWYEVDSLAQELIPVSVNNTFENNQTLFLDKSLVPSILKYIRTSSKFKTYVDQNNKTFIEFGSGTSEVYDEEIIPTPDKVALSNYDINSSIDPSNFLKTNNYGKAPSNTTLTITYLYGGGIESNVPANSIVNVGGVEFETSLDELNFDEATIVKNVQSSLRVNNPETATGGGGPDSDEQIRQNTLAQISSQKRVITEKDYEIRCYSLPSRYGSIAKAFAKKSENGKNTINVYILSYDSNKNLIPANRSLIENLKNYLSQYKMLTDSVSIVDGYIVNVGIDFKISVQNGYMKKEVLSNCLTSIKNYMDIDSWNFNQVIDTNRIQIELSKVDGVQSVLYVKVKNLTKANGDYSENSYNIESATRDGVVYPSIDPCVFEVKYPNKDIKGTYL